MCGGQCSLYLSFVCVMHVSLTFSCALPLTFSTVLVIFSFLHVTQSDNAWQVRRLQHCKPQPYSKWKMYTVLSRFEGEYNIWHLTKSKVADQLPLVYSENARQSGDREQGTKHRRPTARNQCTKYGPSDFSIHSTQNRISSHIIVLAKSLYHLH